MRIFIVKIKPFFTPKGQKTKIFYIFAKETVGRSVAEQNRMVMF